MQPALPKTWNAVESDSAILEGYSADTLFRARPAALVRPRSTEEVAEILGYCNRNSIGVTACGNQTSMTGASVSEGGLLLSGERLSQEWRRYEDPAKPGRWLVDAGPAIVLGRLQDELVEQGFFYPPDPTSRHDILLGATVATNASGEDSYKYGATRRWIRGLTYVGADGTVRRVDREPHACGSGTKNTCGYPIRDNEVDLLIGSEGTLGIITEITLEVLRGVPEFFSILFFFPSEEDALAETKRLHEDPKFDLRCLEYLDAGAISILGKKGIALPDGAAAALYVKQEYGDDPEPHMEDWCDHLETRYRAMGCEPYMEHVHFAADPNAQERMRQWRHHIPATANERAALYRRNGGGKVSTDWYVPIERIETMFRTVRQDQKDMEWVVFGHIGNGHPHFNFLARNPGEYARARELLLAHCKLAVDMGGGVSGEHGLGKLKAHLLSIQYGPKEIERMLAVKRRMDPNGILGRGNIFPNGA